MAKRKTLKAWDAINGAEGRCIATIDGNVEDMIYVKDIEAKIEKEKSEIKVLGQTGTKHKAKLERYRVYDYVLCHDAFQKNDG